MSWADSMNVVTDRTLISGNSFLNNTAIAGGIMFQELRDDVKNDTLVPIDAFWDDMYDSGNGGNDAQYGPLRASSIRSLNCAITAFNVNECNAVNSDNQTYGMIYNGEFLYASASQFTCCIKDMFNQTVTDRIYNHTTSYRQKL